MNRKPNKLLYTVFEIFSDDGFLSNKEASYYHIPEYQRGYKWESYHLEKLLDDIDVAITDHDLFYCIQNITLTHKGDKFHVIDGQQRLTTLSIILAYLKEKKLVHKKVQYTDNSIRRMTNKIMQEWITNEDYDFYYIHKDWKSILEINPKYDLQDIYHIAEIAFAVKRWFQAKRERDGDNSISVFLHKLLHHVKIIVNVVSGKNSEEKIFGNLNSKRIPLDGSDLIRAILITRVAREEAKDQLDLKSLIFVNERRVKLGWDLDQMNIWWSKKDVFIFYKRAIKNKVPRSTNGVMFDEQNYPINLLYKLYAEIENQSDLTLDLIEKETKTAIRLYKSITRLHHTLQDWYDDHVIYHLLGYIFTYIFKEKDSKTSFIDIYNKWIESGTTRTLFIKYLKSVIRDFTLKDEDFQPYTDTDYNWYENSSSLVKALILMDVIICIEEKKHRLPSSNFTRNGEDIEHIFPQQPKAKKLNELNQYIRFLIKFNRINSDIIDLDKLNNGGYSEDEKDHLLSIIQENLKDIQINSIGNLVLLDSSLNKSISNSSYNQKRSRLIKHHNKGNYIQPHTFKVFVRDFVNENNEQDYSDNEFWEQKDIEDNRIYIDSTIRKFLNIENYE